MKIRNRLFLFFVFINSLPIFSQHPGQRGGGAFYWGLIGAIAWGFFSLFIFLLKKTNNYIKNHKFRNMKKKESISNLEEKNTDLLENDDEKSLFSQVSQLAEKQDDKKKGNEYKYCKNCGRPIVVGAKYCPYCGGKLQVTLKRFYNFKIPSIQKGAIRRIVRVLLKIIVVCGIFIAVTTIIYYISDKKVHNPERYALIPIIGYLLYKLIDFAYNINNHRIITISSIASISLIILACFVIHDLPKNGSQAENATEEVYVPKINRTFYNITLGDSIIAAIEKLSKINGFCKLNSEGTPFLEKINFGGFKADTIYFYSYKERIHRVHIIFANLDYFDYDNEATFKALQDKYDEKGYLKLKQKYSNIIEYEDYSTRITLYHNAKSPPNYTVELYYYDKTSGFEEERDKVF